MTIIQVKASWGFRVTLTYINIWKEGEGSRMAGIISVNKGDVEVGSRWRLGGEH